MTMRALMVFLDGVGLGGTDPAVNPFARAHLPVLGQLLGGRLPFGDNGRIETERALLVPVDATLGVPGLPQSATGQATLLTGVNAAQVLGRHDGPWANGEVRSIVADNLFSHIRSQGGHAAFANAYPDRYLGRVARGKGRCSTISLAAQVAGVPLRGPEHLREGQAISALLTNRGWRERLGYHNLPTITPYEAGHRLYRIAQEHDFTLFEYWYTDICGHRGDLDQATTVLEELDEFLGGILESFDEQRDLLILASDHGNLEDLSTSKHTRNPVPVLLVGAGREGIAERLTTLSDVAPALLGMSQHS